MEKGCIRGEIFVINNYLIASWTNFFPVDEKSMQKNPRLRPALLKFMLRLIVTFRTGQGRVCVNEDHCEGLRGFDRNSV
jgi:hypothetical protein